MENASILGMVLITIKSDIKFFLQRCKILLYFGLRDLQGILECPLRFMVLID
jgi:hypothetical protein